jgi:hypothetical protein
LHRIVVSPRAYRTITATLPPGSVVYPPERNGRGEYLLWLSEVEANRLAALRRPRESYSDRRHPARQGGAGLVVWRA